VTWVGQEEEGADSAGAEEVRVSQKPKGLQLIFIFSPDVFGNVVSYFYGGLIVFKFWLGNTLDKTARCRTCSSR
jgi:hypothetical protein